MATKDSISLKVTMGLVIFNHHILQTLSKYQNPFLHRCEHSMMLDSLYQYKSVLMIVMAVKVVNDECKKSRRST